MNTNYNGQRGTVNATVLPRELREAKAKELLALKAHVAAHPEYRRVKRGKRELKHTLTEEVHKNGMVEKVKTVVTTKRKNN